MKKALWLMPAIGLTVTTAQAQSGTISISSADKTVTVTAPTQATQVMSNAELDRAIDDLIANSLGTNAQAQNSQNARINQTFNNPAQPQPQAQPQLQVTAQPVSQPTVSAVSKNSAPAVAARLASRAAHGKSLGRCALYVRKALQSAGYNFTPQASAYMYASNGTLAKAGFTKISSNNYVPQVGDVVVFNRTRKNPHGHIQIYDGRGWVSDFRQPKFSPYSQHNGYTVWRDSRYLDASNNNGTMLAMND